MSANIRTAGSSQTGVVDVSELQTAEIREYAREVNDVYFKRKGGRTFLVTE